MSARDLIRWAERAGWEIRTTSGGHLKLTHSDADGPVFTGSTPSDHRTLANTLAAMKRALSREPKAPPVVERKIPKRRPKPRTIDSAIDLYQPPDPPAPHGIGGAAPRRPRHPLPGGPSGYVTTRWP